MHSSGRSTRLLSRRARPRRPVEPKQTGRRISRDRPPDPAPRGPDRGGADVEVERNMRMKPASRANRGEWISSLDRHEWTRLGGFAGAVVFLHVVGWGLFLFYARSN